MMREIGRKKKETALAKAKITASEDSIKWNA